MLAAALGLAACGEAGAPQSEAEEQAAALAPYNGMAVVPPTADPDELLGLSSDDITAKLGEPALIRRDGELVQFVPFHRRAWHAGESRFRGRSCCNDFSIGIELEGEDDTPYTSAQYEVLIAVTDALLTAYRGLTAREIAAHADISPGRKTDPGPAFDWLRLYDGVSCD